MAEDDGRASTDEPERFRRAAEDALQQLDWCTGFPHGLHKTYEAGVLARQPLFYPSAAAAPSGGGDARAGGALISGGE
jgi:hypothetical protein